MVENGYSEGDVGHNAAKPVNDLLRGEVVLNLLRYNEEPIEQAAENGQGCQDDNAQQD